MSRDEALSRLHAGDLAPQEAAGVRARIASDPDWAAAWQEMQALCAALDGLDGMTPPARRTPPRRMRPERLLLAAGWLLAAGLGAGLARRPAPTATLMVGDTVARLDGQVALFSSEEDAMNWKNGAAVALGAGLTLLVVDGRVVLADTDRALVAGEQLQVPRTAAQPHAAPQADVITDANAAPQQRLRRLRFENALLRGQLRSLTGEPVPWPAEVEPAIDAAQIEETLVSYLDADSTLGVYAVDCEEYPCIVWFADEDDTDATWDEELSAYQQRLKEQGGFNQVWTWPGVYRQPDRAVLVYGVSLMQEAGVSGAVVQRLPFRAGEGAEAVRDELLSGD